MTDITSTEVTAMLTERELFAAFLNMEFLTRSPSGTVVESFRPEEALRDFRESLPERLCDDIADALAESDTPEEDLSSMICQLSSHLETLKQAYNIFHGLQRETQVDAGDEPDKDANPAIHAAWVEKEAELYRDPRYSLKSFIAANPNMAAGMTVMRSRDRMERVV